MPVHPLKQDAKGKRFVLLNEHIAWLRRACAKKGSMHYEEAFQSAVSALRRELQKKLNDARSAESASGRQSSVRESLMVGDSDDDGDGQTTKKAATARSGPVDNGKIVQVMLCGISISMKRRRRSRRASRP